MADFFIDAQSIAHQSVRLKETGNSVQVVRNKVYGVASGLDGIGLGSVAPAMSALGGRIALHMGRINSLSSALGKAMIKYVTAESDIVGIPLLLNPDYYSVAGTMLDSIGAEADASGNVGLYDSEGNFKPSLATGLEAEIVSAQMTASAEQGIMGIDIGVQRSVYSGIGGEVSIAIDFTDIDTNGWDGMMGIVDSVADGAGSVKEAVFDIMGWDNGMEAVLALSGMPYYKTEVPDIANILYNRKSLNHKIYYEYGSSETVYGENSEIFDNSFWNDMAGIAGDAAWGTAVDIFSDYTGIKGWAVGLVVETQGVETYTQLRPVLNEIKPMQKVQ